MTLAKWKPFGDLMSMQRGINRMFDKEFQRAWFGDETVDSSFPTTDIFETKDEYVFKLEVPGLAKEDVDIEFHDNVITIKGEKKEEKEIKEENVHRIESFSGSFTRSFNIPKYANKDNINATMKDGVLELKVAKSEEEKPKAISIKVA